MQNERPLNIAVLLGTVRKGRASAHVARFLLELVRERERVVTELIDITKLSFPIDDAGQAIKDKELSEKMNSADGLVIVAPEYNHSFPGLLKHVLDSNLTEYVHKAVGIAGVSAGPFGGTRVIQNCLAPMRELGFVTIFFDVNFSNVFKLFDGQSARRLFCETNAQIFERTDLHGRHIAIRPGKHPSEISRSQNGRDQNQNDLSRLRRGNEPACREAVRTHDGGGGAENGSGTRRACRRVSYVPEMRQGRGAARTLTAIRVWLRPSPGRT